MADGVIILLWSRKNIMKSKVGMSERRQRAMPMVGGANLTKGWNDSEEVP